MGFDFTTFAFELANFALLLWILQRILYRPLRDGIAKRRQGIADEHARAAEAKRAALAVRAEADARLAEIEKVREGIIADAREQAAKEEVRILERAHQDAAVERERVAGTLERERSEARVWMREGTVDGACEIAGRLLYELLPDRADEVLGNALVASLIADGDFAKVCAAQDRESDGVVCVELRFARPLAEPALEKLRSAVAKVCGERTEWTLHEDAELVAGSVLRIGDHVFDASVAGQLALLRERASELARESLRDE